MRDIVPGGVKHERGYALGSRVLLGSGWIELQQVRTSRMVTHSKLGSIPFILDAQHLPVSCFRWLTFQTRADLSEAQAVLADAISKPRRVGDFIPSIDVQRPGVAGSGDLLCGAQVAHPGVVNNRVQLRYTLLPRFRDITIIGVHSQWRWYTQSVRSRDRQHAREQKNGESFHRLYAPYRKGPSRGGLSRSPKTI